MKKKSESPLNSLNLGGIKPPPEDVERKLARIIKTINSVAERSDNLDVALENEGWRRAVKWLVSHRELAEVTQTWLESSQFGLRMAAICTAAAWVKEEFDRIHWLKLIRASVLDYDLGQWVSVTASRSLVELGDHGSIPMHLEMLSREISEWHQSELMRGLEVLLSDLDKEAVERHLSLVPVSALTKAGRWRTAIRPGKQPNLKRLGLSLDRYCETTVDVELMRTYGRILSAESESPQAFLIEPMVEAMLSRLARSGNRSFILTGPSGVGKTTAIRELSQRLGNASRPTVILEASTIDVMAGTRYIGEWQTRLRDLVEAIKSPKRVLWFVPDIANIFSAGQSVQSTESFSDYLIPLVDRGEVVLIGEATPEASRSKIESSPIARQAFPVIRMNEPSEDTARQIVNCVDEQIRNQAREKGFRLRLAAEALEFLFECADRFLWGVALPGRQIQLLKEVTAQKLEQAPNDGTEVLVDRQDILSMIATRTGIPRKLVDDSIPLDLQEVESFFASRVLGQEQARRALVDRIALIKAGLLRQDKPLGVFFFVGPTGVGKTELAKALAEFLFGSPDRLIRVDMSEYMDYSSFEKLIGNPREPSYTPTVLARVRQQPFSVVLLDEFEKAHPNVFDLFLQVFDNGRLTDASGETSDFRQTIIIMTSNLGSQTQSGPPPGFAGEAEAFSESKIQREMERFFRPEFINRIDHVVTFRSLDYRVMENLARNEIDALIERTERFRRNLLLEIEPSAMSLVLEKGFSPLYGARPLKRQVEQLLAAPLARKLVGMSVEDEALLILSAEGEKVQIDAVALDESPTANGGESDLTLTVPEGPGERELSLDQCRRRLFDLESRYRLLLAEGRETLDRLRETRKRHLAQASDPAFWDHNLRARRILAEARHQEFVLTRVEELGKEFEKLAERLSPGKPLSGRAAEKLGHWLGGLGPRLDQMEVALLRTGEMDHHDVFLSAELLGAPRMGEDICDLVLKMYSGWLTANEAKIRMVDERWHEWGMRRSWTLHARGTALFGWLQAESGLHRFVHESTSNSKRRVGIVKISLLPDPERDEFLRDEIRKEVLAPGSNPSGEPFATSLSLVHLPTLIMVRGQNDQTPAQCESDLRDLLHVRVAHSRGQLELAHSAHNRNFVRQYILSPSPLIKDPLTRLRTGRVDDVYQGRIGAFLIERVRRDSAD